jgi:hypothetical protein
MLYSTKKNFFLLAPHLCGRNFCTSKCKNSRSKKTFLYIYVDTCGFFQNLTVDIDIMRRIPTLPGSVFRAESKKVIKNGLALILLEKNVFEHWNINISVKIQIRATSPGQFFPSPVFGAKFKKPVEKILLLILREKNAFEHWNVKFSVKIKIYATSPRLHGFSMIKFFFKYSGNPENVISSRFALPVC